jgi:hypothetical protein
VTDQAEERPNSKPTEDPLAHPDEAGAYIGRKPERQAETIPDEIDPQDERIAANSTQTKPAGPR